MRQAIVIALVVAGAAGCATIRAGATRSTEEMLAAAGFHLVVADTPDTFAQLASLPPHRIATATTEGETLYVYADPDVCKCVYVGNEAQYQAYQRLRVEKDIADERALDSWGAWPSWPWWW
jgi:hypothetical protein